MSAQAHRGQKRQSGDDYVSHFRRRATISPSQQMELGHLAAPAARRVEDSDVSVEDIRTTFGPSGGAGRRAHEAFHPHFRRR